MKREVSQAKATRVMFTTDLNRNCQFNSETIRSIWKQTIFRVFLFFFRFYPVLEPNNIQQQLLVCWRTHRSSPFIHMLSAPLHTTEKHIQANNQHWSALWIPHQYEWDSTEERTHAIRFWDVSITVSMHQTAHGSLPHKYTNSKSNGTDWTKSSNNTRNAPSKHTYTHTDSIRLGFDADTKFPWKNEIHMECKGTATDAIAATTITKQYEQFYPDINVWKILKREHFNVNIPHLSVFLSLSNFAEWRLRGIFRITACAHVISVILSNDFHHYTGEAIPLKRLAHCMFSFCVSRCYPNEYHIFYYRNSVCTI